MQGSNDTFFYDFENDSYITSSNDICAQGISFFDIFVSFSYIIIMVFSLLGNGIVCYLVQCAPNFRTVTNIFISNLSVGDMLMTIFCVPFSFTSTIILQYWPFGGELCRIVSYFQAVAVFVSAYTLVAISLDRYIAITHPLRPRMTKSHAKIIIGIVWVIALLTALPILVLSRLKQPSEKFSICEQYLCTEDWESNEEELLYSIILLVLQYAVPFVALVFTYTWIAIVVWGKRTPGEAEDLRDTRMASRKRKVRYCTESNIK